MYAVMETGGKQYRVTAGDTLEIEKLELEPGAIATFDRVLMVNNGGVITVGSPTVAGAKVVADVVEQTKADKVIIFKMKRRKGYHKKQGHRQDLVEIKITAINV